VQNGSFRADVQGEIRDWDDVRRCRKLYAIRGTTEARSILLLGIEEGHGTVGSNGVTGLI
jgi:hypothetical protein